MTSTKAGGTPVTVSEDVYWRYDPAPRGTAVLLLTEGGIAIKGHWQNGGGFLAWHPLPKRDHALEEKMKTDADAVKKAAEVAFLDNRETITLTAIDLLNILNAAVNTKEPHKVPPWVYPLCDKLETMTGGTVELRLRPTAQA